MNIVIVGGTGNISASIVRQLLEAGHDVTVVNRGRSGAPPEGARVITGDRQDYADFEKKMKAGRFDAAIDMMMFGEADAASALRAFASVKQLVMCSTGAVYGVDFDSYPVTEGHPLRPNNDYGRNKAAAERMLLEANRNRRFPVTVIRPSSVFGPKIGMFRQIAWGDLTWIDRTRKGKPIVVCGDGSALQQFLYADDAARAFVGVLGREKCIGQVYNVTTPVFHNWLQYHRTAMRVLGRECRIAGVPLDRLMQLAGERCAICRDFYAYSVVYGVEKLMSDVPAFEVRFGLEESMRQIFAALEAEKRIPDSNLETWEDDLIKAAGKVIG